MAEQVFLVDGVMVVDREGKIRAFGEGAERITGFSQEEVIGQECASLFEGDMCKDCPIKSRTLGQGDILSNLTTNIKCKDGRRAKVILSAAPIKAKDGGISGALITFRDVAELNLLASQLEWATAQIATARSQFEAIFNSIADGVFTVDMDMRITEFNRAAEQITGFSRSEALGRPCKEIFRSHICGKSCPLRQTLRTGEPIYNVEFEIMRKDDKVIPISVSTAILYDAEGRVCGGVETFRDMSKIRELEDALGKRFSFSNIVGKSKAMQEVYKLIERVAPLKTTVLIVGESGTGKELVANAIHYNSPRRDKPLVKVNCAALPEALLESELFGHEKGAFTGAVSRRLGRFELADGGTIFLDEIGDMSKTLQAKLLRVLETQEFERVGGEEPVKVDVRVIAATNRDLRELVERGEFREDLYYRLNVVKIELAPLRERREDIPLLVEHFVRRFKEETGKPLVGVAQEVMDVLIDYDWPGNVRELENAIEHAFVHAGEGLIRLEHIPEEIVEAVHGKGRIGEVSGSLEEVEREVIRKALRDCGGNRTEAARKLGISRATLWRKMKKFGIE